jgi:hypothetical protein
MLMDTNRWEPTVGCGLTRDEAREEWARWSEDNPEDKFRVREYRPYGDVESK